MSLTSILAVTWINKIIVSGGTEDPCINHEELLHPFKVSAWCTVYAAGVIGSFFFEDAAGQTMTVDGAMIVEFVSSSIGWIKIGERMVPTGRCNGAHCSSHRRYSEESISRLLNFSFWWFVLAGQITRFNRSKLLLSCGFTSTSLRVLKPLRRIFARNACTCHPKFWQEWWKMP